MRPALSGMKVIYVEVKNKTARPGEEVEGWGVVVNGRLVAADSFRDTLTCGEIASCLAEALGAPLEERAVEVSGSWDWERDVLPELGAFPGRPVVLSVEDDVRNLAELDGGLLPEEARRTAGEGRVTPEVVRRAAEVARDAVLECGYWDILRGVLAEAVREAEGGGKR